MSLVQNGDLVDLLPDLHRHLVTDSLHLFALGVQQKSQLFLLLLVVVCLAASVVVVFDEYLEDLVDDLDGHVVPVLLVDGLLESQRE